MTFTYDLASSSDITRIRYWIRDTDSNSALFQDEEIQFAIIQADGNWQQACIDLLVAKIGEYANTPDVRTSDLTLDVDKMRMRLESNLSELRTRFGIYRITGSRTSLDTPAMPGDEDEILIEAYYVSG